MIYSTPNEIRRRLNELALIRHEATHYGRRPLPPKFADLQREIDELRTLYQDRSWWSKGKTVEVKEFHHEKI